MKLKIGSRPGRDVCGQLSRPIGQLNAGENSAGAVNLLDQRSQWQRVGLISGESQEKSQPLLAPLYYINKAIQPFAEVIHPKDANLAQGLDTVIKSNATFGGD